MGIEAKPKPTAARFALAANLKRLMASYSKGFAVGINAPELEQGVDYRVSAKTILRILNPYSPGSPRLDSIEEIATFFKVDTWEILKPRQSLDARITGEETPEAPADSVKVAKRNKRQER